VDGVGAVGSICERRGALGIDANTGKTLVIGGAGLTVGDVSHPRCRRAFAEETKPRFAVSGVDAVFSLRKLGFALVIDANEVLGSARIGGRARLTNFARTTEPLDTDRGFAMFWVGAGDSICEWRGAHGIDANTRKTVVVGSASLTVRNVPRSGRSRAFLKETKSRFTVCGVDAVFSLRELGLALGEDANQVLGGAVVGGGTPLVDLARRAETGDAGGGGAMVRVEAVGAVRERRGALGVDADARKTVVVSRARLTVGDVSLPGVG